MQNGDHLLYYLTLKISGTWEEWRSVTKDDEENTKTSSSLLAYQLAECAHVEFDFDGDLSWNIAPSVLAGIEGQHGGTGVAVLCGARTQELEERIDRAARSCGLAISRSSALSGLPAVLSVHGDESELEKLARLTEISWQPRASGFLAALLPTISDLIRLGRAIDQLPTGHETRVYDLSSLTFQAHDARRGQTAEGSLYRVMRNGRPEHWYREGARLTKTSWAAGAYKALAVRNISVVEYQPATQSLHVPFRAPLPILHARTAALCSVTHRFETDRDQFGRPRNVYRDVPPHIAQTIMNSLAS
jgi:hypothetical protein